jgi:hypothetical protein
MAECNQMDEYDVTCSWRLTWWRYSVMLRLVVLLTGVCVGFVVIGAKGVRAVIAPEGKEVDHVTLWRMALLANEEEMRVVG